MSDQKKEATEKKIANQPEEITTTADLNKALDQAAEKAKPATQGKKPTTAKKATSSAKNAKPAAKATGKAIGKKVDESAGSRGRKAIKVRVGQKGDFPGFGKGTKLGNIFESLKAGKYNRAALETRLVALHPNDEAEATKRTIQVQLSHYRAGRHPWKLEVHPKSGKMTIK
jgi:hypothetical protein